MWEPCRNFPSNVHLPSRGRQHGTKSNDYANTGHTKHLEVSQGIGEGLSLLDPLTCPASWPAHLVEWVDHKPTKKASPVLPTTADKSNTPVKSDKPKSSSGSSNKNSSKDPESMKMDEQSQRREEQKCSNKTNTIPVLSLVEHEEPVSFLLSKTIPSQLSQPPSHPSRSTATALQMAKPLGKVRRPTPDPFNSLDDNPLCNREEPKAKTRKRDHISLEVVLIKGDEPLSASKHKTLVSEETLDIHCGRPGHPR